MSVQFLLFSLIVSQTVKANITGSALVEPPTAFNYVYQSGKFIISWEWGVPTGGDETFSVTTDQVSAINYNYNPPPVCLGGCTGNDDSAYEISVSEDNANYRHLATVRDTRNYEFTATNHSRFQFRIRVKQSSFSGSEYYSDYLYSPIFNKVGAVLVPKVDSVSVFPADQYLVDGAKVYLESSQANEIYYKISNNFDNCSINQGWQLYSLPFTLSSSAKICTLAKKQGWIDSDSTSHSFTLLEPLAYPLMAPSGGTISSSSKITLNNTQYEKTGFYSQQLIYNVGVVQYKILNYQQSCDVSFWRTYIAPFKLNGSSRVCARVILEGQSSSSVSYKDFNLKLDYLTISPNGGNYSANTQFSISNPQSAAIKYKT